MDAMENPEQKKDFTCSTCNVKFVDLAIFRNHFRSEWHRYNLHATSNGLPPITLEELQKKEAIFKEELVNTFLDEEKQFCEICRKKFRCQKQYDNHLASKTHKKMLELKDAPKMNYIIFHFYESRKSMEEKYGFDRNLIQSMLPNKNEEEIKTDSDVESLDSDEWLEDSKYQVFNNCLFCDYQATSIIYSMGHMVREHSFYIPYIDYCVNLCGLLEHLEQKICTEFKCIWCNDSGRKMRSAEAVKMHMIDKGHCKMLFEGEILQEYSPFYDYSSSYPDAENANPDEESPEPEVLDDNAYIMKLPSGKSIVHRDLALYYKQNVHVGTTATIKDYNYLLQKRMLKNISLGTEKRKIKAAEMTAQDNQRLQQIQAKYSTQLQVKQNKLQKYFRRQTGF